MYNSAPMASLSVCSLYVFQANYAWGEYNGILKNQTCSCLFFLLPLSSYTRKRGGRASSKLACSASISVEKEWVGKLQSGILVTPYHFCIKYKNALEKTGYWCRHCSPSMQASIWNSIQMLASAEKSYSRTSAEANRMPIYFSNTRPQLPPGYQRTGK